MALFSSLDNFWTLCKLKLFWASQHPDKGVCQFSLRLQILAMSQSSDALLDHITDYLRFISNAESFWFTLNTSMTMATTLPVNSVWTRKTTRLCLLLSRGLRVVSLCQLVDALPIVVLSLRHPLIVLTCQLVVGSPLAVFSLRHPLSSCCTSVLSHCLSSSSRYVAHSSSHRAGWLLGRLDAPPSHRLVVSKCCLLLSCCTSWLSHHHLLSSSCCTALLISHLLAGCCDTSPCAALWLSHRLLSSSHCMALLSSCHASWLLHCLSLSSCCATLLSTCRISLLSLCLSSTSCLRRPLVLSSYRLVIVSPLDALPSCRLVTLSCRL